jgi:hypothetical protein
MAEPSDLVEYTRLHGISDFNELQHPGYVDESCEPDGIYPSFSGVYVSNTLILKFISLPLKNWRNLPLSLTARTSNTARFRIRVHLLLRTHCFRVMEKSLLWLRV